MQRNSLVSYGLIVIALLFVFQFMNWGTLVIQPPQTITVIGTANSEEANQIASFYAGVTATNADKQVAVTEVNTQIEDVLAKIKEFGVDPADIQTQNMNVFQEQEEYTEGGVKRSRLGMWSANSSLSITLRDISKASDLVALLTDSGLTDVSGPNFTMDDSTNAETALLTMAVKNAREKADLLAEDQKKRVFKVLSITEGFNSNGGPIPIMGGAGLAAPVEPGSTTVSTSVTVTFEIR